MDSVTLIAVAGIVEILVGIDCDDIYLPSGVFRA